VSAPIAEDALLGNHLAFLASHRGSVVRDGDTIVIESDRPEFTYAILRTGATLSAVPDAMKTVQIFPSCRIAHGALVAAGFAPIAGLSYMILDESAPHWRVREDLTIARVRSQPEMDAFSEVQTRAFFETEEAVERWRPWLTAANDRNLHDPDQAFYVGRLSGSPVGTTLTVVDGASAGLYAVATLAQHRRSGVATTLMRRAVGDARARGCTLILLQVKQDSSVERLYERLGFRRAFATPLYHRTG
jgi:GNAT superfamily N-acetyltransferase